MKQAVVWERRAAHRPGQAHVFPEHLEGKSYCGAMNRHAIGAEWERVTVGGGRLCATCRRHVDPEGAPKAPKGRWL